MPVAPGDCKTTSPLGSPAVSCCEMERRYACWAVVKGSE